MDLAIHLILYASILVFVLAVVARFLRIARYPINLRWEVYPVPTEGARARHGGSRLEDVDWWEHERKPDKLMEMRYMIPEMLFIKALFEHNRKLWYRSFPFHFGLYLLAAFAALLAAAALTSLAGWEVPASVFTVVTIVGATGALLALAGALGLLWMRATDADLRPYTNFSHFFNLIFFVVSLTLMLLAWREAGWQVSAFAAHFESLFGAKLEQATGGPMMRAALVALALLLAWIPLTHMSHFFVKWFTWHKIRWDDEPNVRGGRIEKLIQKALESPVSWSAPHIGADGKKSWGELAVEEMKSE